MNSRTLKIEEHGDPWKGKAKAKIRLCGNWLERAGFRPGSRVTVVPISPGVIELRSENPDVLLLKETGNPS